MTGIPDGSCPRCGEKRPRDGHIGHQTEDSGYCTVVDGRYVFYSTRTEKESKNPK